MQFDSRINFTECVINRVRSHLGPPNPDIDHIGDGLAGRALPLPASYRTGNRRHLFTNCANFFVMGTCGIFRAQRRVQGLTMFAAVDLFAINHGDLASQQIAFARLI